MLTDAILSLPEGLGILASMVLASIAGVAVYLASARIISPQKTQDLKDAMGSLFRVIGTLVSLMLSLAFAEVVFQVTEVRNAVEREILAIADAYQDLASYDTEQARETQALLVAYTASVITDDWPALANDEFAESTSELRRELWAATTKLEPTNSSEERLVGRVESAFVRIAEARLSRLDAALAQPPVYLYAIIFGFLVTMVCFGAYTPSPHLIALVTLYTSFLGLVVYLVLALSDPFAGDIGVTTDSYGAMLLRMDGASLE